MQEEDSSTVQTVEIIKRPGQSLGFYIREGNGRDRWDGVFISRLAVGSVADQNGLLRVGDEILSVNGVDVTTRRLEDVVISMSIPKRLVLTVRTQNANNNSSETTSSSSLSAIAGAAAAASATAGAEDEELAQAPVVVVKGGRSADGGGGGKDRTKSRSPERRLAAAGGGGADDIDRNIRQYTRSLSTSSAVVRSGPDSRSSSSTLDGFSGGRLSRHHGHHPQMPSSSYHGGGGPIRGGDNLSDGDQPLLLSTAAADNSRYFHPTDQRVPPSRRYGSLGSSSATELYENIRNLQNHHVDSAPPPPPPQHGPHFDGGRNRTYGKPRTNPIQLDYSSDPDSGGYPRNRIDLEQLMLRYNSAAKSGGSRNNTLSFPERLEWAKGRYDVATGNPKSKYPLPVENATLGRRFSVADQYDAELNAMGSAPAMQPMGPHAPPSKERPMSARDRYITQMMINAGEKGPPEGFGNGLEDATGRNWKGWTTQRSMPGNLSVNQINKINCLSDELALSLPSNSASNYVTTLQKDVIGCDVRQHWSTSPTNAVVNKLETVPRAVAPTHQRQLTRKMSADSLFDYKTYQMEDPGSTVVHPDQNLGGRRTTQDAAAAAGSAVPSSAAISGSSGLFVPFSTMTLSRAPSRQQQQATMVTGSSTRDHHLAKAPLHIRKEAFKHYQAAVPGAGGGGGGGDHDPGGGGGGGISGQVSCHIFCGHGLVSSRAILQDLYCVVEVDALGCARTTVHTGAMNFDWDDRFEVDVFGSRTLSFLVYTWDPFGRHRLAFSCVIGLPALFRQSSRHRLAVKMDPKGILYTELVYRDPRAVFHRTPSVHADAFFGVGLQAIVDREKTGMNVPVLVHRCIEEVERRGLDQVGLYRLCGSAKRKQHLREELERNPWTADLSAESVGDINIITVVLKDFLRELPEPLCTTALHQMLMDALSVQLPGDIEGNATLLLAIIDCWPKVNQETLSVVLDHLRQVSLKSDVNKMSIANLAVCLGPILLSPGSHGIGSSQAQIWNFPKYIELLKYILDIWPHIRDKLGKPSNERGTLGTRTAISSSHHHHQHHHQHHQHRSSNHVD